MCTKTPRPFHTPKKKQQQKNTTDQAAEPIARLGFALRVPWASVPCCVYARDFPRRRLRDGTPVRSYEELISYLLELDEDGPVRERALLAFEGRNRLVFWLPPRLRGAAAAAAAARGGSGLTWRPPGAQAEGEEEEEKEEKA